MPTELVQHSAEMGSSYRRNVAIVVIYICILYGLAKSLAIAVSGGFTLLKLLLPAFAATTEGGE